MKKKKIMLVILIIFILISIPIIIIGRKRYGDNWIDFGRAPSICYYDGRVYAEITHQQFHKIDGEYEQMDKWITKNGNKAGIFDYYCPLYMVIDRRVCEVRDDKGIPIALLIGNYSREDRYYKLCEEKSE